MSGPRVVVIGAGVVGAAVVDELSALGWDDIALVDQGPFPVTGGSTSHAPGVVFQANPVKTMTEFARYTVQKLGDLDCFLPVGGLEVATTPERLADLHRRHGWLTSWGVEGRVLGPAETVRLHPLLDPDAVLGGLYVPTDGVARAVRAVEAQVRRAVGRGVRLLDRHTVTDVTVSDGRVTGIVTDRGAIPADVVVCAAGIWGPRIAAMAGLDLPLTPLAHQLGWTGPLAPLAGNTVEATLPVLRHQGHDLYYRERFDTLAVGWYGHRPMPIDPASLGSTVDGEPMPSVLPFTRDDFTEAWAFTRELLPATADAKIEDGINGIFSFTSDSLPLLGPSSTVEGFWFAEAVWITHSAGVGRAVAEWLVDGHCSSFDVHECDINRFEPHQHAPQYVLERDSQNFVEVYDVIHPLQPAEKLRPLRTSPYYSRQIELGGAFFEANGWERPHWFESNADLVAGRDLPTPTEWAAQLWSPIVGAEAQVTRERVALYDMTSLKRVEVTGPGSAAYLQGLVTGNVDKSVGSVTYCLVLDVDGGIRSDVTVARLAPDRFQIGINGSLDLDWFRRHLPASGTVQVRDITAGTCCIGLWGPRARDVLAPLTDADVSNEAFRYFRARELYVGAVPVTAMRLSYVGELGWELYTTADLGLKLWDTLWEAGLDHGVVAGGRGAFASLRLEKGYRSFGADMTFEHDPYEAGLGFAVKLDSGDFVGRDALLRRKESVSRRLTCLTLDGDEQIVLGKEPVHSGGEPVGYVTSAAYGYTMGCGIAYAWLPAGLSEPGTRLSVRYFDRDLPAVVTAEPLVDPKMERLRS